MTAAAVHPPTLPPYELRGTESRGERYVHMGDLRMWLYRAAALNASYEDMSKTLTAVAEHLAPEEIHRDR